ncbi:hypothetical protein JTB14_004171 [Gonioctena quinquepunctata]|nr:hypothetical protein JTB14_004171 [Gonioctena quinquepunctata]
MEIKLLSCPVCSKPHFEGVDALRTTLVTVATSLVTCPVCCETLMGLDKLTIHLFSHISNATVSKNTIEDNVRNEIDKSIENASKSADEVAPEVVPASETLKCDICNFSFTDKNILEMHQKLLHQTSPDRKTGTYSYHCHLCSKKFRMRGSLMVHLRVAHYGFSRIDSTITGSCNNKSDDDSAVTPVDSERRVEDIKSLHKNVSARPSDNKQWECDVCSKMFTTKYFLKKHKRLHTGEMPYCCALCNKSFTFQQSYHKHMLYHSSEKPHVCNECGRAFKELSTLQNHARIHSGERPFVCETCGKSFRQRVSYLVHRRIHTGVMPYKCTACDKSFRYKVSQKSHKCPVNPPGSVILVPEQKSTNNNSPPNSPSFLVNVDITTGNVIDVSPKLPEAKCRSGVITGQSQVQKKSIMLNNNEMIEISYNKADLQSAIESGRNSEKTYERSSISQEKLDDLQKLIYGDTDRDLFPVVLSPILPDVESLYINSSPTSNLMKQERDIFTVALSPILPVGEPFYLNSSPTSNLMKQEQTTENKDPVGVALAEEKYFEEFLCDI